MPRADIPPPPGRGKYNEIVKCGVDPIYFMKHYVYISHPKKGLIKFDTYPFQDDCVRDFEKHRFNIVLKSRQLGLSTVCAAYVLWMAIFQKQKNILIIATKLDVAKNFLRKVRTMFDSLPAWLVVPKVQNESVKYLEFSNGSRITAIPTGDDAGRSEGVSLLVVDEAAHIQGFDELWMGLYSTVSTGGNIILLSTPKGVGNVFHKTWMGCDQEKKTNDFHGINLPWTVHPEHDESWFQEQCRNLDPRGIRQELLCSFEGSGQTYLNDVSLAYLNEMIRPPVERMGHDMNTWVWKYPITGHSYLISADVARGDSDDFSTAYVIDTTDDEVVAEYQGKIPPDRFADLLVDLGTKYLNAMICPEKNTFGLVTAYRLRDLKYPNLYYEKFAKNSMYQTYTEEDVKGETAGFTTTPKNRPLILAKLEENIRNRKIKIYSSRFAEEAKTFIWNTNIQGGKAQAMKGYNDDLMMCLAIGCWLFETSDNQVDNAELNRAMMAAWGKSTTTLNGTGFSAPAGPAREMGINPWGFQRGSTGPTQGQHYQQQPNGKNVPPGVDPTKLQQAVNVYNVYSWLFNK